MVGLNRALQAAQVPAWPDAVRLVTVLRVAQLLGAGRSQVLAREASGDVGNMATAASILMLFADVCVNTPLAGAQAPRRMP